jgi:hypothetical protein
MQGKNKKKLECNRTTPTITLPNQKLIQDIQKNNNFQRKINS